MDFLLRKVEYLQEALYDLEEFLESNRDNDIVEFVSDHWKECLLGAIVASGALYLCHSNMVVSPLKEICFRTLSPEFSTESAMSRKDRCKESQAFRKETPFAESTDKQFLRRVDDLRKGDDFSLRN